MGQSIDRKQLLWGVVAGVITVVLMVASYFVGLKRGEEGEEEILGGTTEQGIEDREIVIAIRTDCSGYETGTTMEEGKEVRKYCVIYEEGKNAFDVMKKLSEENENFSFDYEESDFGVFITSINNYHPDVADRFWAFVVNGEMSMVGVSEYEVIAGDNLGFKVEEVEF
jgi:hypothetical protein